MTRLGSLLATICFFLASPGDERRAWLIHRGDSGLSGVVSADFPGIPRLYWRVRLEGAVSNGAVIAADRTYVATEDGFVYALQLDDGREIWKRRVSELIEAPPSVIADVVYIGTDEGVLYALDTATGAPRWTVKTDSSIHSAVNWQANDVGLPKRLLFGSYDGMLYCIDAAGEIRWKYLADDRVHGTPAIIGDAAVFAGCDGHLHAVRLSDGAPVGRCDIGAPSGSSAAHASGRVFIGTYGNQVIGIAVARLGEAVASTPTSQPAAPGPAASMPASASTVGTGGMEVLWAFRDPSREHPFMSSAAATDKLVVIGGRDKRIRAFDAATGRQRWDFATRGRVDASPVIVGSRVFCGSSDGTLYALSLDDGRELWRYESGAAITASPAVVEDRLVIGNVDGTLMCFGSEG